MAKAKAPATTDPVPLPEAKAPVPGSGADLVQTMTDAQPPAPEATEVTPSPPAPEPAPQPTEPVAQPEQPESEFVTSLKQLGFVDVADENQGRERLTDAYRKQAEEAEQLRREMEQLRRLASLCQEYTQQLQDPNYQNFQASAAATWTNSGPPARRRVSRFCEASAAVSTACRSSDRATGTTA